MINKLISNIRKTNAPIVVGLDPMLNYIPEHIPEEGFCRVWRDSGGRCRSNLAV